MQSHVRLDSFLLTWGVLYTLSQTKADIIHYLRQGTTKGALCTTGRRIPIPQASATVKPRGIAHLP
jgi:hypothetical protein